MDYYTPKKEDLHIGYECEVFTKPPRKMAGENNWYPKTITQSDEGGDSITIQSALQMLDRGKLRANKPSKEWKYIRIEVALKETQRTEDGHYKMTYEGKEKVIPCKEAVFHALSIHAVNNLVESELESIVIRHKYDIK